MIPLTREVIKRNETDQEGSKVKVTAADAGFNKNVIPFPTPKPLEFWEDDDYIEKLLREFDELEESTEPVLKPQLSEQKEAREILERVKTLQSQIQNLKTLKAKFQYFWRDIERQLK